MGTSSNTCRSLIWPSSKLFIFLHIFIYIRTALIDDVLLSIAIEEARVCLATRYRLDGPGVVSRWGVRFSASVQTGPGGAHPVHSTMGTGSFPGVMRPGRGVDHPPQFSAEVNERVELYLYTPSGSSWPVIRCTSLPCRCGMTDCLNICTLLHIIFSYVVAWLFQQGACQFHLWGCCHLLCFLLCCVMWYMNCLTRMFVYITENKHILFCVVKLFLWPQRVLLREPWQPGCDCITDTTILHTGTFCFASGVPRAEFI